MKRLLFVVILLGVCAWFGIPYFTAHRDVFPAWLGGSGDAKATPAPATASAGAVKRLSPPGIFYMVERVSRTSSTGVSAVEPGEEVRLMERKKNGRLLVTTGKVDFVVKASQVTNDLDRAQQARQMARSPSPP